MRDSHPMFYDSYGCTLKVCITMQLTTLVYPFVYGSKVFDMDDCVLRWCQSFFQNMLTNLESWSVMIVSSRPQCFQTCSKKCYDNYWVVVVLLQGMRISIFLAYVDHYQDYIMLVLGSRIYNYIVHGNRLPWLFYNMKGHVQILLSIRWVGNV